MNLTLTSAPDSAQILACLPVATFKTNMRIAHSVEDDKIEDSIREAFDYFDGRHGWLRRALLTQTWTLKLPGFTDIIELPLPPLQSVRWVKYRDTSNDLTTLYDATVSTPVTSDVFHIITGDLFGRLQLAYDQTWPETYTHPEAVEISFIAGYGAASAVPRGIRKSIGLLAGHYYQNQSQTYPEPRLVEVPRKILMGIERAAGNYRIALPAGA